MVGKLRQLKDKRNKRLVVRIRWPFCGVFWLLRRRLKRFMFTRTRFIFTRSESCPGLPHFFREGRRPALNIYASVFFHGQKRACASPDANAEISPTRHRRLSWSATPTRSWRRP